MLIFGNMLKDFIRSVKFFLFSHGLWSRLYYLKKFLHLSDPDSKKKIIDIGGGSGRIAHELDRPDIHVYDLNPAAVEIAKKYVKNAHIGTGTKTPFKDNYFNYAISIHTFEHIPQEDRESFLLEIVRISKDGFYLNFPEGKMTEKLCINYLNKQRSIGREPNKWTLEHLEMGLPNKSDIIDILSKQNKFDIKIFGINNYYIENFVWSNLKVYDNKFIYYFILPVFAFFQYAFHKFGPKTEIVIIAKKTILPIDRFDAYTKN